MTQREPDAVEPTSTRPPRFPEDFPPRAISLRRDYGAETELAPDEPDAVLADDELHLFGLDDGHRMLTLAQIRSVRWRGRVLFAPWRLIVMMLLLVALMTVSWLVDFPGYWGNVLGIVIVVVSLLVIYLRKDTDRVSYRFIVLPELGGRLTLELPESVPSTAVQRFGLLVIERLRGDGGQDAGGSSPVEGGSKPADAGEDGDEERVFRRQRR